MEGSSWPTYSSVPKTSEGLATSAQMLLYSQFNAMCWLLGAARAVIAAPFANGTRPAANTAANVSQDLARFIANLLPERALDRPVGPPSHASLAAPLRQVLPRLNRYGSAC